MMLEIIGKLLDGRKVVGYVISNGYEAKNLKTSDVISLVKNKRINGVKYIESSDKLTGYSGFELKKVPSMQLKDNCTTKDNATKDKDGLVYISSTVLNNVEELKKEVLMIEKTLKDEGCVLGTLSRNASRVGFADFNEIKAEEYYAVKKQYDNVRDKKNKILDKLRAIEIKEGDSNRTFVNGYGEATSRYITSSTYERQQKRLSKEVMQRMCTK